MLTDHNSKMVELTLYLWYRGKCKEMGRGEYYLNKFYKGVVCKSLNSHNIIHEVDYLYLIF